MRVGDRERRRAQDRLRHAYLRGELGTQTFETRLGAALAARVADDLRELSADLPCRAAHLRVALRRRRRDGRPVLVAPAVVPGRVLVLGRSRTCDVRFVEASVSRCHAELRRTAAGWLLVDRSSSNGTFVNGVRVARARVRDGDEIRLGEAGIVLRT
ncbi:DUF1707 and FHA domain-containing protein [Baekduia soli]|uniref:DUF1707 and FHA domain-containing protein n=1 Tax=Baekduia soli TaxID=496014 RepID=UPI001652A2C2|nr:DUF1707 and FHA domain-containing protein [Baekduia soli]